MVLDIILIAVVVLTAVYGFRKGFIFTLIHTCGTVGALVLAYFATSPLITFLKANTDWYTYLKEGLADRFSGKVSTLNSSLSCVPSNISSLVEKYSTNVVNGMAKNFASVIFAILVFIAAFLVIKLILWLILRLVSREYNGRIGIPDGIGGLIIGLLKGVIFVFIILALLMPITNFVDPSVTTSLSDQLNNSHFAKTLYDNNFIVLLLESLF